ncbi:type I restriction endonuclease subunit R [Terrisporobacter hibernicus]|uniref:Type I restriction enzyme endonuclease subunit n=1 Tax=Terrisporobacter hibernicus TaxID=2813371 RepID=A0AAX2ZD37_9FIRM|nr:HsdR family type I site-specific deoxyribonuclease [Terrisporobacter hibernicus]UEL47219.1 HsdR family type I site-specific deoxyribonuclease [Terrisporobacter hibernicus]
MSEYIEVESPFLTQLKNLGWTVIDHREGVVPTDPNISLRENFREIVIKSEFKKGVKYINRLEDDREWLTDKQLNDLYNDLTNTNYKSLPEANKAITELLVNSKPRVDKNEVTGEDNVAVKLIDFDNIEDNSFIAINQYRVDTVGTAKKCIIPDIVLFINGIPVVVIECKVASSYATNPMEEGITQLLRYQNRRLNTAGNVEKEGEEQLFYYNQFMISTYGDETRVGTISSSYDHYLPWKSIYPKKYQEYELPLGKERSQEVLVQGMLNKENIIKIIKNFIIYKPVDVDGKIEIKIVSRYQQFRAVCKTIDRLLSGKTYKEKSGVIWHTQGSGKSLTMVFLVRQMRNIEMLKDYKVLMVNDRTDLEEQLAQTAKLTGETIDIVENSRELKSKLSTNSSNVALVMMHKFGDKRVNQDDEETLISLGLQKEDVLPHIEALGVINDSDRILILIDESHRTQNNPFGLAGNLFKAFPNSCKIAFTGTPLITGKHKRKTTDIFGTYIDTYKSKDSVRDGSTLQLMYIGRKDKLGLLDKATFDSEYDEVFKDKSEEELKEIKKKYGSYKDFLESDNHIKTLSYDIIDHYSKEILPNGFKAQVVCISKVATAKYKKYLDQAIDDKIKELEDNGYLVNDELLKKLRFIKTAVIVSDGGNDKADVIRYSKESKECDAIENFKKKFDYDKPETGIAILVVCSKLLTGFDAPIEQVMYLDKKMKEHNLFQAITRVNRTAKDKYKGYIVDYANNADLIAETLAIYSGDDEEEVNSAIVDVNSEKPILNDRYLRLTNLFKEKGIIEIEDYITYKINDAKKQYEILERCIEVCEDLQTRAKFETDYKIFLMSLDVLIHLNIEEKYIQAMKAFGHIQARIKHRYKDDSINLMGVGEKIKELINKHVESKGISNRVRPLELFDVDFKKNLEENKSTKAKASEMEHATRKHININKSMDPALYQSFSDKLDEILKKYDTDIEARYKELEKLLEEILKGREDNSVCGLDSIKEAPFYDLILNIAFKNSKIEDEEQIKSITVNIVNTIICEMKKITWGNPVVVKKVSGGVGDILLDSCIDELEDNEDMLVTEIMNLARKRYDLMVN